MADHEVWQRNLVNRLDPDGTVRAAIDARIAHLRRYPEPRRRTDAPPQPNTERSQR